MLCPLSPRHAKRMGRPYGRRPVLNSYASIGSAVPTPILRLLRQSQEGCDVPDPARRGVAARGDSVGKKAREDRRRAARAGETNRRRGYGRPGRRTVAVLGGAIALAVLVLAVGTLITLGIVAGVGGGGNALPSGTAVFDESSHEHVTGNVQYDRTPPAGGAHNALWLNCGVYGDPVPSVNAVHSLEHGAVWITYRPDLPAASVSQLQQFVETHYVGAQRYLILSSYVGIPSPIVASAWGAQLQLSSPTDPRLAAFVAHYQGGAQGGEPRGKCSGGTGNPIA